VPILVKIDQEMRPYGESVDRRIHRYTDRSKPVFTALHGMQTRSSDEKAVCPSVRPSVCLSNACIVTKRKKDLSRFLYHTKDHLA